MIEKINENSDLVGGSSEQDKLGIKLLSYSLNKKYKICESLELVVGSGEQNKLRLETKETKVSPKILLVKS